MSYQPVNMLQLLSSTRGFILLKRELAEPTFTHEGSSTPLKILNVVSGQLTALGTAVLFKCLPAVILLIEHGANPDLNENAPPIMYAARIGHPEIVRQLLMAGADPNALPFYEWQEKQTALMWAVRSNQPTKCQIALLLLNTGLILYRKMRQENRHYRWRKSKEKR